MAAPLRGRLMVGRLALDQVVKVRILAPQPHEAAVRQFTRSRDDICRFVLLNETMGMRPGDEALYLVWSQPAARRAPRPERVTAKAPAKDWQPESQALRPGRLRLRHVREDADDAPRTAVA